MCRAAPANDQTEALIREVTRYLRCNPATIPPGGRAGLQIRAVIERGTIVDVQVSLKTYQDRAS